MITQNAQVLFDIKNNIKQALENKGVDMVGVPFNEYASKIGELGDTDLSKAQFLYTSGNGSDEFSVTLGSGKKLIALIGTNVYWEGQDNNAYLYFTIGSTTTQCSTSNGLYQRKSQYRSAGRATTTIVWLNTGEFKDSEFVKASIKGGWGDGVVQMYAIYQ